MHIETTLLGCFQNNNANNVPSIDYLSQFVVSRGSGKVVSQMELAKAEWQMAKFLPHMYNNIQQSETDKTYTTIRVWLIPSS